MSLLLLVLSLLLMRLSALSTEAKTKQILKKLFPPNKGGNANRTQMVTPSKQK